MMGAPGCEAYRVLFDAVEQGPPVWFAAFGLIPMVPAVIIALRARSGLPVRFLSPASDPKGTNKSLVFLFVGLLALASLGWTTVVLLWVLGSYRTAEHALEDGTARVVEGRVEAFHPMPAEGHDTEHFTVSGVYFAYSDFVVTSGFNQTSSHGGPVHAGMQVRIHYVGAPGHAEILKLEGCD
jgi:hypothetical protein